MHRFETIDLGTYRGDDYVLVGFVEPEPAAGEDYNPDRDADEYGVSLARSDPSGSNVEIVRLDTAHGQRPHVDQLYLQPGRRDRKTALGEDYTYERMKRHLLTHWRRFVDLSVRHDE